jgi:hypothetical protein
MHKSPRSGRFDSKSRGIRVTKGYVFTLYKQIASGNLNIYGWNIPPRYPHPPTRQDLRHGAVS